MTKFINRLFLLLCLALLTGQVHAAAISVGKQLSPLTIEELGECRLEGGKTSFAPWDTHALLGNVHVFEYVAARAGIDEINQPFYQALEAAKFAKGRVQITTLVNANDALWGTSGLVAGEIEKNKLEHPEVTLVVDAKGLGQRQWDLQKKNAAIAILAPDGEVLLFQEGGLSDSEIYGAIEIIRSALAAPENVFRGQ